MDAFHNFGSATQHSVSEPEKAGYVGTRPRPPRLFICGPSAKLLREVAALVGYRSALIVQAEAVPTGFLLSTRRTGRPLCVVGRMLTPDEIPPGCPLVWVTTAAEPETRAWAVPVNRPVNGFFRALREELGR